MAINNLVIDNKKIASALQMLADLMELHQANPFKIKSIYNAARVISKLANPINLADAIVLADIPGIGKSIAHKIAELAVSGTLIELEKLLDKTPKEVAKMLTVKGIGPKKTRIIWQELGIDSFEQLLKACQENKLADAKGFGLTTQAEIQKAVHFTLQNTGKVLYPKAKSLMDQFIHALQTQSKQTNLIISATGDLRRLTEVIEKNEYVLAATIDQVLRYLENIANTSLSVNHSQDKWGIIEGFFEDFPFVLHCCETADFHWNLWITTGSTAHINAVKERFGSNDLTKAFSEEAIYKAADLAFIPPELRESVPTILFFAHEKIPELITLKDLKGVLHVHSTYSDGANSLQDMALYCRDLGFEYLGITDHSQSAFYAGGLTQARIFEQHAEIDVLNKRLHPFKIFKGIESDILNDGSLDYSNEILASFDFIIASIHSNLKMDSETATQRLIKAIENPYTTILGHPTGRLLLSREGYQIDHKRIIDACAMHQVSIELNANPRRLDLDWHWIDYAMKQQVSIAINPDAHEKAGFHHLPYGINMARKGGLGKTSCLNALNLSKITKRFETKKRLKLP